MGKLGRFACIFTPMALSIASLVCLLNVFLGGLNKNDANLRSLYFFSADASQFKANSSSIVNNVSGVSEEVKKLLSQLIGQIEAKNLKDVYYIYMWNYCSGSKSGTNGSTVTIDYCSPRKAQYYFNPINEWGLNGTTYQQYIPKTVNSALGAYQKAAGWMFIAYAVAFWTTVATIIVGLFAICSRVGSCLSSLVSGAALLFSILAAITSTILFPTLVGALEGVLKPYQINMALGTKMLAVDWLAVAFSAAAFIFWVVSICCCSGRSSRSGRKDRGSKDTAAAYSGFGSKRGTYQPLHDDQLQHSSPAPYHSQYGAQPHNSHEMHQFGAAGAGPYKGRETAYEPFRHV